MWTSKGKNCYVTGDLSWLGFHIPCMPHFKLPAGSESDIQVTGGEQMAKIRKRKVRWNASSSPGVIGYKVYWAVGGGVNYDSDFAEVGNVTEIILPDDIPAFPVFRGDIQLGITAVTEMGNESEMMTTSAPFEFLAPDPPIQPILEPLEEFFIRDKRPREAEQSKPQSNFGSY